MNLARHKGYNVRNPLASLFAPGFRRVASIKMLPRPAAAFANEQGAYWEFHNRLSSQESDLNVDFSTAIDIRRSRKQSKRARMAYGSLYRMEAGSIEQSGHTGVAIHKLRSWLGTSTVMARPMS